MAEADREEQEGRGFRKLAHAISSIITVKSAGSNPAVTLRSEVCE